jgi:hypothetical protein
MDIHLFAFSNSEGIWRTTGTRRDPAIDEASEALLSHELRLRIIVRRNSQFRSRVDRLILSFYDIKAN